MRPPTPSRLTPRLVLIVLVACGLYFPSSDFTGAAQQSGTVNVRPRATSSPSGVPEVRATVDRSRVPIGEVVTFTLSPARIVSDPRYRVTLFFGDGQRQIMRQAQISHAYSQTGTYTYAILVEPDKPVTPPAIPSVKLTATPTVIEVNQPVSFSAQLSGPYPDIKYRFVFGDGSDSGWQDNASAAHSYRSANTYPAYVDIGIDESGSIKQTGGSRRESIKVTEPARNRNTNSSGNQNNNPGGNANSNNSPRANANTGQNRNDNSNNAGNLNSNLNRNANANSNLNGNANVNGNGNTNSTTAGNTNAKAANSPSPTPSEAVATTGENGPSYWWWIIIAAIVLLAAYQAYSHFFAPKPTFVPHPHPGEAKVAAGKPFGINLQLDVDPNVAGGEFKIDTRGNSFIKSQRTEP